MKTGPAIAALATVAALAACSSTGPGGLPPSIGNGAGSEFGNYTAESDGEMKGPSGERCVVFNWDRPISPDYALRLRSASCESAERPGWMVCRELSRTLIPIGQSNLRAEAEAAGKGR